MSSRIYTSIYEIDGISTLEDIKEWKFNCFNDPVKHSKRYENAFNGLPDHEKYYNYTWDYIEDVKSLQFSYNGE